MIRKIKIYLAYFKIKFLNEIQYKIAALAGVITQFAWGGMYIMLYTTFLKNGTANDYTIAQMSTYLWLQQAFYALFHTHAKDKDIIEQCETGNIAMELVKPIDLYAIWHSKILGKRVATVLLRAIPILTICCIPLLGDYSLKAPVSLGAGALFIITLTLSAMLMMSYVMLMYIIIMKTMSSKGIKLTFQIIMEGLSGALIPIAFMPDIIIKIIKLTPFYYMQNVPFNIYNGYITNPYEIAKIIFLQIIWIAILTIVGKKMMKKQLSKIVVQGG